MNSKIAIVFVVLIFGLMWYFHLQDSYKLKDEVDYESIYDEALHNDTGYITKISGDDLEIEIDNNIYQAKILKETEIIYNEPKDVEVLAQEIKNSFELGIDPPSASSIVIKTKNDLSVGMTIDIESDNPILKDNILILRSITIN